MSGVFYGTDDWDHLEVADEPDENGEVEFEIYIEHHGISAGAKLRVEDRRQLIAHLQRITPDS